jgi:hypothetical protein
VFDQILIAIDNYIVYLQQRQPMEIYDADILSFWLSHAKKSQASMDERALLKDATHLQPLYVITYSQLSHVHAAAWPRHGPDQISRKQVHLMADE